jgi:hypothetical protein
MRHKPYDYNEERACDYIQQLTKGVVGCGDDPVGFLIASHAAIVEDRDALRLYNLELQSPLVLDNTLSDKYKEENQRLRRCLGFFASVIKSGETWTETCQREYDAALGVR